MQEELNKFNVIKNYKTPDDYTKHAALDELNRDFDKVFHNIVANVKDPDAKAEAIRHLKECLMWSHKGML